GPLGVRPVGFEREDQVLPCTGRTFWPYRLVQEYFAFPEKYLFFDVEGMEVSRGSDAGEDLEIVLLLDAEAELEGPLLADTFRLGCTPVVNLFRQQAEPIALTRTRWEYDLVPDARRRLGTEVHSIENVRSATPALEEIREIRPFYSLQHGEDPRKPRPYWCAIRRPSGKLGDRGTEVSLSFVDRGFQPASLAEETVTALCLCTNRDLPARLPFGRDDDFQAEGFATIRSIRCLRAPTATLRPPGRRAGQWHLISLLSLNHLPLVDSGGESFRGLLGALDFAGTPATAQQIEGIVGVESRPVVRRVSTDGQTGFCRGTEVTIHFDEDKYVGTGVFLLGCVLERFLSLHATLNSFTQLLVRTRQTEGVIHRWPPRIGERELA
ncbi:MAG TPA: type VI secretion system baseplate subunit TssF, partial [Planctomycetota bacterium]|nr:type VI secretion system baseplate subunit TssF [Planctomycetota bacterium]